MDTLSFELIIYIMLKECMFIVHDAYNLWIMFQTHDVITCMCLHICMAHCVATISYIAMLTWIYDSKFSQITMI